MLSTEVYYHHGYWWFALVELGRLGQILDRSLCKRCKGPKDARTQAAAALAAAKGEAHAS